MAKLTVITGASHTGKSSYLLDRIEQHMQRGEHAILLVPEQSTYRYELRLCERLGGLIGIEVYSFERLCQRLIARYGETLPTLSDQGRCMVLRRAAYRQRNTLRLFTRAAQLKGFAASMDARIGRFQQSCITPGDLEAAAGKLPETDLLRQKLLDFSVLYRESESFLQRRYLTSNDLMTVAEPLIDGSFLSECHIYVDDFDRPREQAFRLLLRLLHVAKSVTITLRMSKDPALADLFMPDRRIYDRLYEVCAESGILFAEYERTALSQTPNAALLHLEQNLFSAAPRIYPAKTDAIAVLAAKDRQTEAALIADRICELVQEGKRFSDFALVVSDLTAYGPILRRAFARRKIPLFYDATRPISGLASTDFVLSLSRAACLGFPMGDILRILKSGYAGISTDDAEQFENYVLRYGIYGSELDQPFSIGEIPPEAERVRAHLMETLLPLREAMRSKKTSDKVLSLWTCLKTMRLREQLETEAQTLLQDGFASDAQLTAQVWDTIKELLVQTDTVLGDTEIAQREFPMLLEEGLSGFSIGLLPGQRDAVTLGDLVRTRLAPVDTLFVLGCNEGMFPPARTDDDLLNDAELEVLQSLGLSVWGGTKVETAADRLALYSLLSKARSCIVFSYAFSEGGSELTRAPLISQLLSLYPAIQERIGMTGLTRFPMSKAVAFSTLAELISVWKQDGYCSPQLPVLLQFLKADPDYADAVQDLLTGSAASTSPKPFGKAAAKELYGASPSMSASRLEQFARCPFAQYVKYGLHAEERKTAEEKASDAGTFLHDALDAFVKAVSDSVFDWNTITEPEIDAVLDAILPQLLVSHNDGIFSRDPRLKESLFLRLRTVRLCAYSIARQLKTGRFEVAATEMSFGMDDVFAPIYLTLSDGTNVSIYGKIDRVDRTPDGRLLRIIDYKMGKTRKFDPSKLLSGESLQLPLYFSAAKQLGGECAGLYYMPLTLDAPEEGEEPEHKLYGLTASDPEAINAAEPNFDSKSTLIHDLKRAKDGSVTGAAASRARINEIIASAERIAARQAEGILNGRAELLPTESACKWCPYRSVCRFDKQTGCKTRYVKKVALADLLTGKEELP